MTIDLTGIKKGIIYKITNTVNNKCYIGQTIKPGKARWNRHLNDAANGSTFALHAVIRKYGLESFTFEVIAESLQPFLDDLEIFFIKLYSTKINQHGYNMTDGGDGNKGGTRSEETRRRLSLAAKGRVHSEHAKRKMSLAKKGKVLSEEHKRTMSLAKKGIGKGKVLSEEIKRKIGLSKKDRIGSIVRNITPYGFCECGCDHPTPIIKETNKRQGRVKGLPSRFINGHNNRIQVA
jgi:group I intron endonuclease